MRNRHVQTIIPRFFRPFHNTRYQLELLDTPDGDFLELAWSLPKNDDAPLASDAPAHDAQGVWASDCAFSQGGLSLPMQDRHPGVHLPLFSTFLQGAALSTHQPRASEANPGSA